MEFYIGFVIFLIIIVLWGMANTAQLREQERSHEKVKKLIEEGHNAEVSPKCKGKRMAGWGDCSQCGGLGYSYKLNKEKLRKKMGKNNLHTGQILYSVHFNR